MAEAPEAWKGEGGVVRYWLCRAPHQVLFWEHFVVIIIFHMEICSLQTCKCVRYVALGPHTILMAGSSY